MSNVFFLLDIFPWVIELVLVGHIMSISIGYFFSFVISCIIILGLRLAHARSLQGTCFT